MTSQEDDTVVMHNEVLLLKVNKFKLIECTNALMGMYKYMPIIVPLIHNMARDSLVALLLW